MYPAGSARRHVDRLDAPPGRGPHTKAPCFHFLVGPEAAPESDMSMAKGRPISLPSNMMRMAMVSGTLSSMPTPPQSHPQNTKQAMTTKGLKFMLLPIQRG